MWSCPNCSVNVHGTNCAMETKNAAPSWCPALRILFRFLCVYLVLYGLQWLPFGLLRQGYQAVANAVVPWVAKHVLGLDRDIAVALSGSGDRTFDYVVVICCLAAAAVVAAVWTLLDRQRSEYRTLHLWLRLYVRVILAVAMIDYGAVKVLKVQFPDPSLELLLRPFGEVSPGGLLWIAMGVSDGYNVFTGATELLGGTLLFFWRTTLLGALICIGVLSNVVALNFSYDIPVKLFSSHLLGMAVFLAAPDARRLANVLLFNRPAEVVEVPRLFGRRWLHGTALVVRTCFICAVVGASLVGAYERWQDRRSAPKSPLYGIWETEEFELDGKARPPLVTDALRWRRVIFEGPGAVVVQRMGEGRDRFQAELDGTGKTLVLKRRDDPKAHADLTYERPAAELLLFTGRLDGRSLRARLRRGNEAAWLLTRTGFNWITE
jgi:hypothetical protein